MHLVTVVLADVNCGLCLVHLLGAHLPVSPPRWPPPFQPSSWLGCLLLSAHRHDGLVVTLGELGLHVLVHGLAPSDHHGHQLHFPFPLTALGWISLAPTGQSAWFTS